MAKSARGRGDLGAVADEAALRLHPLAAEAVRDLLSGDQRAVVELALRVAGPVASD